MSEQPPSKPLTECFAKLSELDAPLGIYAVLGNHDSWNLPLMRKAIKDAGIELLENKAIWLEEESEQILLAGVTPSSTVSSCKQEFFKNIFLPILPGAAYLHGFSPPIRFHPPRIAAFFFKSRCSEEKFYDNILTK